MMNFKSAMKKIFRWVLILIAIIVLAGVAYKAYLYVINLPKKITTYQGVTLGESKDQVFYALGVPTTVLFEPVNPQSDKFQERSMLMALKSDIDKKPRGEKDFNVWQYETKGKQPRVTVWFDPKTEKVDQIACFVDVHQWMDLNVCNANGVVGGTSEEDVVKLLGNPQRELITGSVKTMFYPQFNMKVVLEKKTVYYILVNLDPNHY